MTRYKLKTIIAAILILLVIIVIAQNMQSTPTRVLFMTLTMPRALLLLITFALGVITGLLLANRMAKPKSNITE